MNPDNIVVFLDAIQRTIIATQEESPDSTKLVVSKPVILNVSPTQDKRLQVQLYPLFFREFTASRDVFAKWSYDKSNVVISDVQLEPNIISQYKQLFQTAVSGAANSNKVIKLFDEES